MISFRNVPKAVHHFSGGNHGLGQFLRGIQVRDTDIFGVEEGLQQAGLRNAHAIWSSS